MAKRKRKLQDDGSLDSSLPKKSPISPSTQLHHDLSRSVSMSEKERNIQIITGSYDRVLHGIIATIPMGITSHKGSETRVRFADNFLFNAHESAIRCLAISPPSTSLDATDAQKIILASGGTDEKVNLYHISAYPTPLKKARSVLQPSLNGKLSMGNPRNRELGSLLHHSSSINVLHFPTRSKLLSGADDNTIAVSRTRDWTVLSTIKAPIPRAVGQPSGDTAPPGTTASGVVDFAVHPSMKLMISVGKGERCMRLWNLVTGKKAGVLSFERDLLRAVGEGKHSKGEGRKVKWNSKGDEYVVAFERGAAVFGMDSKPRCVVVPSPPTKIHQLHYLSLGPAEPDVLIVSTEDGRLIFCSSALVSDNDVESASEIPDCQWIGQLGGKSNGVSGRIKDFELLPFRQKDQILASWIAVTAGSNGMLQLWEIERSELLERKFHSQNGEHTTATNGDENGHEHKKVPEIPMIGRKLGSYSTDNRITCLKAFSMLPPEEGDDDSDEGIEDEESPASEEEFQGLDDSD